MAFSTGRKPFFLKWHAIVNVYQENFFNIHTDMRSDSCELINLQEVKRYT